MVLTFVCILNYLGGFKNCSCVGPTPRDSYLICLGSSFGIKVSLISQSSYNAQPLGAITALNVKDFFLVGVTVANLLVYNRLQ